MLHAGVADLEIELSSPGSKGAPSPTSSAGVSGERPDQFPPPLLWAELGLLLMARREEKMRRRWSLTSVARGKMAFF